MVSEGCEALENRYVFRYQHDDQEIEEKLTRGEVVDKMRELHRYQMTERPFYHELKKLRCYDIIAGSDAFKEFLAKQSVPKPVSLDPTEQVNLEEQELVRQFQAKVPGAAERLLLHRRKHGKR